MKTIGFILTFILCVSHAHAQVIDLPKTQVSPIQSINGEKLHQILITFDGVGVEGMEDAKPSVRLVSVAVYRDTVDFTRPDGTTAVDTVMTFFIPQGGAFLSGGSQTTYQDSLAYVIFNSVIKTDLPGGVTTGEHITSLAKTIRAQVAGIDPSLWTWRVTTVDTLKP